MMLVDGEEDCVDVEWGYFVGEFWQNVDGDMIIINEG